MHASHLIPVPESMSFEEAACVCEAYVTAYLNLFMLAGLDDRYTVLLHGGGGGVNTAAIQLCRTLAPDVRVIVTCSPRKIQRVRDLGADLVVDYTADDFATATRDFTNGRGADVVLDHIGASYLESNLRALGSGGRLVIIGVMGGTKRSSTWPASWSSVSGSSGRCYAPAPSMTRRQSSLNSAGS